MKLPDHELLSIIRSHRDNSLGVDDGELSNERADALDHYHGRPYGDEQKGRSQVVSKDLAETVDWAMPVLIRAFIQSGNIAEFAPEGPEDEEGAQQESDYINYVVMKQNNGFLMLHDWFKDALLLKNGYVKHWVDESEKIEETEYEGLSEDELAYLLADDDVEIIGQDERLIEIEGVAVVVYDVRIRTVSKEKKICVEPLPVEEVRVSKRCRGSTQSSPFTEHVTTKTRTELLEMGMPESFVSELPAIDDDENDDIRLSRDSVSDESYGREGISYDRSMDEIEYCEAYLRVDYDGDGRAELRKVITCANQIPPGEEWNEPIDSVPITSIVPKRVPHRHVGESLDDELGDLQRIKTVLFRQLLDNAYLTNSPRHVVNERINLNDMLSSLPGGLVRANGKDPVDGSARPLEIAPIINQILPVIDYVDGVKESRSGITKQTTGLDPDILKESTKGAYMENLNRASQKVEMIARMFAETGVRELVLRVHELSRKHIDKETIVKLRGKYVSVNPTEWKERTNLSVKVGLGTGTEDEKREKLMLASQGQDKLGAMGLVMPQHAYQMWKDFAGTLSIDAPEKYALDPSSPEYQQEMQRRAQQQQPQPNPLAEVEQIKGQYKMQSDQMQAQLKMTIAQIQEQHKHEMDMWKQQIEFNNKEADRRSREAIEAAKLEVQALIEGMKIDLGSAGIGAGLQE